MRAKDPLPLRIEGGTAFPEAAVARGDDGFPDDQTQLAVRRVAARNANVEALLVIAGAGMSVDSGRPNFRTAQGFWARVSATRKARLVISRNFHSATSGHRPSKAAATSPSRA